MKIIITETQYNLLFEHYDKDRLYNIDYIIRELKRGPRELRHYINKLPRIACEDNDGNTFICTKIPEVIYTYLNGTY